ncbi:MAG: PDDEXK nuclease domain-containing protein, partial [Hyphomicrobiaceae bacterium]
CMLLDRVKNLVQRQWYMQQAIENGWSRNVLALQIESGLYEHKGKALTNFSRTLPEPDSDLAQQVTKDRYTFDFLDVSTKRHEREIERGLVDNICAFILELGKGFAFLGNQYHMEIAEKDYYLDLLFYHVRLRCYVVFELKTTEFKPEYAGKMNFYLSAVDDLLRHPDDKRSIGIVLCKINSSFAVEYALRDMTKPIGVAEYCVTRQLPDRFQKDLPTAEELTARFHSALDSMAPASSKKARLPRRRRPPP